jgi:hypothetical protein
MVEDYTSINTSLSTLAKAIEERSVPASMTASASADMPPATDTVVVLDTFQVENSNYSILAGVVTVSQGGVYDISYFMPVDIDSTAGGTRSDITGHIQLDDGAGFSNIVQSKSRAYIREAAGDGQGVGSSFICTLPSAGDIRMIIRVSDPIDVSTEAGTCQLSIHRVK